MAQNFDHINYAPLREALSKDDRDITTRDILNLAFHIATHVGFDEDWNEGAGYYAALAADMKLVKRYPAGSVLTTVSPEHIRLIIITTPLGNVVLRATPGNAEGVTVSDMPLGIANLFPVNQRSALTYLEARRFMGLPKIKGTYFLSQPNAGEIIASTLALAASIANGEQVATL